KVSARDAAHRSRFARGEMETHSSGFRRGRGGGIEMTAVADESARARFARELDQNFSVIASARSGKPRAIAGRFIEIANDRPRAPKQIPTTTSYGINWCSSKQK